jgi:asparagine synthase (glutamine-hydrolysing)
MGRVSIGRIGILEPNQLPVQHDIKTASWKGRTFRLTGICAFAGHNSDETRSKADAMLRMMDMRGTVREVADWRNTAGQVVAIGIIRAQGIPLPEPHRKSDSVRVLDGIFFPERSQVIPGLSAIDNADSLFESPGAFAFLGIIGDHFVCTRDPVGLKPLYWGTDEKGNYGFASLIAPLKSVGIADPKPVTPGQIIELSDSGPQLSGKHSLARPSHIEVLEDEAIERLGILLLKAVSLMVPEISGLAFSGGVDSALVAAACKKVGLKPTLITVGIAGQQELQHAGQAAKEIGLPIITRELTEDEVLKAVSTVVQSVETKSPLTLGISLPFHFACQQAHELGLKSIIVGQLSDELFGGYARFEETALKDGPSEVDLAMWNSVLAAAEGDFAPGDKVAASFGLDLCCPFAYLPLARYALELPVNLRVNVSGGKVVRKYLLRRLAEKWRLPAYISNRPKRAFQYSTGVQKVLVREAKRKGRRLGELLFEPAPENAN